MRNIIANKICLNMSISHSRRSIKVFIRVFGSLLNVENQRDCIIELAYHHFNLKKEDKFKNIKYVLFLYQQIFILSQALCQNLVGA